MNADFTHFFDALNTFLITDVLPISNELDQDSDLLKTAYQQLIALGGLGLLIPNSCGGLDGSRQEWITYNIVMAQYSGALLFLQAQHQSAITHLKKMLPHDNVSSILRDISQNKNGLGAASNRYALQVQPSHAGFLLSGGLPWVSGWGYFSHILISFNIDETLYYTLLPFKTCLSSEGGITISPPHITVVFNSVNTVSVTLKNWYVDTNHIIATTVTTSTPTAEHPAIYNFAGAAKALLDLAAAGKYATHDQAATIQVLLSQKWHAYYEKIMQGTSCPLTLRAEGRALAEHCASFARIVCGSAALLASHPLTRISRELWQYTTAGNSQQQLPYYLEHLLINSS